jgi:hypothetical protein
LRLTTYWWWKTRGIREAARVKPLRQLSTFYHGDLDVASRVDNTIDHVACNLQNCTEQAATARFWQWFAGIFR